MDKNEVYYSNVNAVKLLGVSKSTVEKSKKSLREKGLLQSRAILSSTWIKVLEKVLELRKTQLCVPMSYLIDVAIDNSHKGKYSQEDIFKVSSNIEKLFYDKGMNYNDFISKTQKIVDVLNSEGLKEDAEMVALMARSVINSIELNSKFGIKNRI